MTIKRFGFIAIFALVSLFIMGSGNVMALENFHSVDANSLSKELKNDDKIFLLDVREKSEYKIDHIKGAVLIPLGSLPDHINEIPKDEKVVVYCRSGNRSSMAVRYLIDHGFTNIINLTGGMMAWSRRCSGLKEAC